MTAPGPLAGLNPWTKTYQTEQFDTTQPPAKSVLDSLATPPAAGITAETTPAHVFAERDNPPPGAGGNPSGGIGI